MNNTVLSKQTESSTNFPCNKKPRVKQRGITNPYYAISSCYSLRFFLLYPTIFFFQVQNVSNYEILFKILDMVYNYEKENNTKSYLKCRIKFDKNKDP